MIGVVQAAIDRLKTKPDTSPKRGVDAGCKEGVEITEDTSHMVEIEDDDE